MSYPAPPAQTQDARPFRKRHPKTFWGLIVLGVLIVLGILGSLTSPSQPTTASSTASSTAASTTAAPGSSAPAKATRSSPGVGDEVRDGKFAFTVHGVKCGVRSVGGQYGQRAQGQYCLVNLTVKNIGNEPQTMFSANQKGFRGETEFSVDDPATIYAAEGGDSPWLKDINPGNALTGVLVFDIPKGAKLDRLELHDSAFSGGVNVRL